MNTSIKRGVAIALLLFTFTVPAPTFAMTNEGQIESQSESIYEPQKEEFEKMLKDDVLTPSKEEKEVIDNTKLTRELMEKYIDSVICEGNEVLNIIWK